MTKTKRFNYCSFCGKPLAGTQWASSDIDAWHVDCSEQYTEEQVTVVTATEIVDQVLKDALPPSIPPSFKRIKSARYLRIGKHPIINAELEMFDGLSASVQLTKWNHGYSHQWTQLNGGSAKWNNELGKWERVDDV